MKWILKIGIWLGLTVYLVVVLGLVTDKVKETPCQSLSVELNDTAGNHFISEQEVYSYILDHDKKLLGRPLGNIKTDLVEKTVASIPFVRNAEVFKTSEGSLHVAIKQREPVMHVLVSGGKSYYVDMEGFIMPESASYTPRTLVVNGSFLSGVKTGKNLFDPEMKNFQSLKNAWKIACYIHQNRFWKAQIEQIWISGLGEFTLIPRVGAQSILFGDISSLQDKFENLYLLYKQGFSKEGWNTYKQINLKYENQVVCTKR